MLTSALIAAAELALASAAEPARSEVATVYAGAPKSEDPFVVELLALNRSYIDAARRGDLGAMKALTTDDYIAVNPYYPYMLDDADRLVDEQKAWAAHFKPGNGDEVLLRSESAPRVKRYGDVAILAYVELEAVRTRGDRVRAGRTGKCTFIYRRIGGQWLLANSHITAQAWPDQALLGIVR
jgi:ketosteroid isomerase-like protein